jgi:para-nitrobenzyl esterase
MIRFTLLGLVACLVLLSCTGAPVEWSNSVPVESGLVAGEKLKEGIRVFRGIPYAAPPTGDLRWRPPQPVASWDGIRDATTFGPACPQPPGLDVMLGETLPEMREDCLFLNIWSPAENPDEALPVMVWIHGGGLFAGWSHHAVNDGTAFSRQGILLVSINYRLGPLGFLAHPALTAESSHGASGNYGFLDQVAALEWVQRNIAAFGGDPDKVTIFGESAGGLSVFALLASPLTEGLFHRAIGQSGSLPVDRIAYATRAGPFGEGGEERGLVFAAKLVDEGGDASLSALRAIDAEAMVDPGKFAPFINVGGRFMPEPPEAIFASGRQQDVPLIVGTNANEGTLFLPFCATADDHRNAIRRAWGELAEEVLALYPVNAPEDLPQAVDRHATDGYLRGSRVVLRSTWNTNSAAYQYHFTRESRAIPDWKAHHFAEVKYIFNTPKGFVRGPDLQDPGWRAVEPEPADLELRSAMIGYWSQFATTGDPNMNGLPRWPTFEPGTEEYLDFGDTIRVGSKLGKERCDRLDELIANASR